MRNTSRWLNKTAFTLLASAGMALGSPSAAEAAGSDPALRIQDMERMTGAWSGSALDSPIFLDNLANLRGWQNFGNFKTTATVLKAEDDDPDYDFFVVKVVTDWKVANDVAGSQGTAGRLTIRSNWDARIHEGSGDIPDTNCTEVPISVPLPYGFATEISPNVCYGAAVVQTRLNGNEVTWETKDVRKTPKWENVFFQRVGQGFKPKFTIHVESAEHSISWEEAPSIVDGFFGVIRTARHWEDDYLYVKGR